MTESTPIQIKNISVSYGEPENRLLVLDKVSFDVAPGEFVCIVGSSGSGKSTLLKILARLERPDTGQVLNMPKQFGFVFQNFALFPWLTVAENIGFGLRMRDASERTIKQKVHAEIERMGLTGFENTHPKQLSGGMKQRVGIARALAVEPSVLLLDEPFSALDEITAQDLRDDLLKIWRQTKTTIIMVTHLAEEAVYLSDNVVVFSKRPGRVLTQIANNLPRPRSLRHRPAYQLIDQITNYLAK